MRKGGSAPPLIYSQEEANRRPPGSHVMMVFLCMQQSLVKSNGCSGGMGKRRRPRPINRHASVKAAGGWGPRRSALALWLRLEAKYERALGPRATIGVLGTGVPRLACLRPRAWLHQQPGMTHLHLQPLKTLVRGQASRGGRHQHLLWGSLPRPAPEEQRYLCKGHLARSA